MRDPENDRIVVELSSGGRCACWCRDADNSCCADNVQPFVLVRVHDCEGADSLDGDSCAVVVDRMGNGCDWLLDQAGQS